MTFRIEFEGDVRIRDERVDRPGGSRYRLEPIGPTLLRGEAQGQLRGLTPARVVEANTGLAAVGVPVVVRLLRGGARLRDGALSLSTESVTDGAVEFDLQLGEPGSSILTVELEEDPNEMVSFATRTDQVTDRIAVDAPPATSTDAGATPVDVLLLDHLGAPVTGATPRLSARIGGRYRAAGTIREIGSGRYEGHITLVVAGEWTLEVSDPLTGAVSTRCIHITPGQARGIELSGEMDPRLSTPRSEVTVVATLIDRFGNALNPARLRARARGGDLGAQLLEETTELSIARHSAGSVRLSLRDVESRISRDIDIAFSEASLTGPDAISWGDRFTTPLFLYPRPRQRIRKAEVRVAYDPRRVRFLSFSPQSDPRLDVVAQHEQPGDLTIVVASEDPIMAAQVPDGYEVGVVEWECVSEGETCFEVTVATSPEGPGWTWCTRQKLQNIQCICVEVLYPTTLADGGAKARLIEREIESVIGYNVERCCPIINVRLHHRAYSAAEWRAIIGQINLDGDNAVTSDAEFNKVVDLDLGDHADCIQFFLLPHQGDFGGQESDGEVTLAPGLVGSRNNVGVHEAAHALGLRDRYELEPGTGRVRRGDANDLMGVGPPPNYHHGNNLSDDDCETIWGHLNQYRCR